MKNSDTALQTCSPWPWTSPDKLKSPYLEQLYVLLSKISSEVRLPLLAVDSTSISGVRFSREDLRALSGLLYGEINRQAEGIISGQIVDISNFILLLRCCFVVLPFLEFDRCVISRIYCVLIIFLKKSTNLDVRKPSWYSPVDGDCLSCLRCPNAYMENADAVEASSRQQTSYKHLFWSAVLEVFIHELVTHKVLKKYFILSECFYYANREAFCGNRDRLLLGLVCAHFFMTVSDGPPALDRFFHSFMGDGLVNLELSRLSLSTSLMLLHCSCRIACPRLLLGYLFSLVSNCVAMKSVKSEEESDFIVQNYMFVLQLSIKLYCRHMSVVLLGETRSSDEEMELNFLPPTYAKMKSQIDQMVVQFNQLSSCAASKIEFDIMNYLVAYMEEKKHILDESCRGKVCIVLKSMMRVILLVCSRRNIAHGCVEVGLEDACLLAALLKLMGCALLHLACVSRKCVDCRTSKTYRSTYSLINKATDFFGKHSKNEFVEKILPYITGMQQGRHSKTLKIMAHMFCCLHTFSHAPDFLKKNYIFMTMALTNIAIRERGFLRAFRPLLCCTEWCSSTDISPSMRHRVLKIATNYMKAHKLAEDKDTCNGEPYINAQKTPSELVEFADFIVCKKGKDYNAWMKNMDRFSAWRRSKQKELWSLKRKRACHLESYRGHMSFVHAG